MSIEMGFPGSFQGLLSVDDPSNILTERLMYYSYITMLTIGYLDITPVTSLAQKASILIGEVSARLFGDHYSEYCSLSALIKHHDTQKYEE